MQIDFEEISTVLLLVLGGIFTFLIISGLILLVYYGHKIDSLYELMQKEKDIAEKRASSNGVAYPFLQGEIKAIEKKFQPKLERFERRRKEVIDFMPFFKK